MFPMVPMAFSCIVDFNDMHFVLTATADVLLYVNGSCARIDCNAIVKAKWNREGRNVV